MIYEHVSITVTDLEKSIKFYTTVFGFSVLRRTPTTAIPSYAYLFLGNDLLELVQSDDPTKVDRPQTPDDWVKSMSGPVGLNHIGFRVDDMDEAVERIQKLGGEIVVPPKKFKPKIAYVTEPTEEKLKRATKPIKKPYWIETVVSDPDGVILELLER